MRQPLISILIPFKNTSIYLNECLQSIINQTYTNWELLIVDDNSTDNSYAIVKKFAEKDLRIKLFKNDGKGIIEALRLAFKMSKGSLITRMDSDDIMASNKLEVLSEKLMNLGKGHVAIGLIKYFSKNGIGNGYAKYETWLNNLTQKGSNYNDIYKECVIPSPCWMVYRSDFLACDAFYPNKYPEDYDLAFRFYLQGLKCIPCNNVLHFWRDYPVRASRTDKNYAQNHFLEIKLHYFLKLHHTSTRPLIVWGAGQKGKFVANYLFKKNIPFYWMCNNSKKIGKDIYQQKLLSTQEFSKFDSPQAIITVANTEEQSEIKSQLKALHQQSMLDYFFFC